MIRNDKIANADKIDAVIFDWGGVITNIDYYASAKYLTKYGLEDIEGFFSKKKQYPFFDAFEIGQLSAQGFRDEVKKMIPKPISNTEIDYAWSLILEDTPIERIKLIQKVKKQYRTFLLSNTNILHYEHLREKIKKEHDIDMFKECFEYTYLSHAINRRKPNADIFEYVMNTSDLIPEKTLFIDDSPQHVEAARSMGINAYHLETTKESILDLFEE
ncbi:HAD family phosphatase [Bacteroidales bacterium]|nr:HAD family phosphatase [Bacteroidales bacterium]